METTRTDPRIKSTMDCKAAWDGDQKDRVAEKVSDNYFHMRQHSIYCKTSPLWNTLIPPKMPEQQAGSDAGDEEVATVSIRDSVFYLGAVFRKPGNRDTVS